MAWASAPTIWIIKQAAGNLRSLNCGPSPSFPHQSDPQAVRFVDHAAFVLPTPQRAKEMAIFRRF